MVGWRHLLIGHEVEQTLGDSEGQGSLVCCSSWGHKESDMTEQLNIHRVHLRYFHYILLPIQKLRETWVRSLGWEYPLKKEMATHSSSLLVKAHGQKSVAGCRLLAKSPTWLSTRAHTHTHTHTHNIYFSGQRQCWMGVSILMFLIKMKIESFFGVRDNFLSALLLSCLETWKIC